MSKLEKENSNSSTCPGEKISGEGRWVLEKLNLSGMQSWFDELQSKVRDLLCSYSDIFSKHDVDMDRTDLIKHDIKPTNPNLFKESYMRIPSHLHDEVRPCLKKMLDLCAIRKSQKPLV